MPVLYPQSNPLLYALQQGTGNPKLEEALFSGGWSNDMIPDWYKVLIGIPVSGQTANAVNKKNVNIPTPQEPQTFAPREGGYTSPQPERLPMMNALYNALQYPYNGLRPRTIPTWARMGREVI